GFSLRGPAGANAQAFALLASANGAGEPSQVRTWHPRFGGRPDDGVRYERCREGRPRSPMAALIEAIEIKRKMFFEYENAPYHCLEVEVSRPTARGGQTLVRLKMRNMLTRAVFDRTFKAGEKFREPDLAFVRASFQYSDTGGYHFMDQETFGTIRLSPDTV